MNVFAFMRDILPYSARKVAWRFPNFTLGCRTFATLCAVLEKLRRLMFSLPLHGFALFNHNQETLFCSDYSGLRPIYAAQPHPKHFNRHMYSRCMVRSGEAESPNARSSITNRKWIKWGDTPLALPFLSPFLMFSFTFLVLNGVGHIIAKLPC